jgi:[ribosomal protein S5]-alanine N-acetyltransferase
MNMRLIPITLTGLPAEPLQLPEIATIIADQTIDLYKRVGYLPPWIGYYAEEAGEMIGACGFKSPPQNGRVEIAYFTLPEFEGQGVATDMARELVRITHEADPTLIIAARTLQDNDASMAVLRKLGFTNIGIVQDPEDGEVWEWVRKAAGKN